MKRITVNDLHEGDKIRFLEPLNIPHVKDDQIFTVYKKRMASGVKIRFGIDFFTYANIPNWRRMKFEIVEREAPQQLTI